MRLLQTGLLDESLVKSREEIGNLKAGLEQHLNKRSELEASQGRRFHFKELLVTNGFLKTQENLRNRLPRLGKK